MNPASTSLASHSLTETYVRSWARCLAFHSVSEKCMNVVTYGLRDQKIRIASMVALGYEVGVGSSFRQLSFAAIYPPGFWGGVS